jgi:hypothetical protein
MRRPVNTTIDHGVRSPAGPGSTEADWQFLSLKSLAQLLDTTRSSARRWMKEAGVLPVVLGRGRNGAIRFRRDDVEKWISSRERIE